MMSSTVTATSTRMAYAEVDVTTPNDHLGDQSSPEYDPLSSIPMAPEDPMFGLSAAFRNDPSTHKVDLGVGAYRDAHLQPFVLPVVKKVRISTTATA